MRWLLFRCAVSLFAAIGVIRTLKVAFVALKCALARLGRRMSTLDAGHVPDAIAVIAANRKRSQRTPEVVS